MSPPSHWEANVRYLKANFSIVDLERWAELALKQGKKGQAKLYKEAAEEAKKDNA